MTMFKAKGNGLTKMESLQSTPKSELHRRKIMLNVWWDHHGIIHFETVKETLCPDL